ncbi:MAG: hypothetical protein WA268_15900 [Xanthobacteraceae bacterium]
MQLVRAKAFLAGIEQVNSHPPLGERYLRSLKNRAHSSASPAASSSTKIVFCNWAGLVMAISSIAARYRKPHSFVTYIIAELFDEQAGNRQRSGVDAADRQVVHRLAASRIAADDGDAGGCAIQR